MRDLESILFKTEEYGDPVFVVEPAEVERGDDSLLGFTIPADTAPGEGQLFLVEEDPRAFVASCVNAPSCLGRVVGIDPLPLTIVRD
ncbi:MAG: hypothetical protein IT379_19015 [Deltaproteobacteria bacterium]|nr:hypothetical protein [Deltaproteobacteria bacterium]